MNKERLRECTEAMMQGQPWWPYQCSHANEGRQCQKLQGHEFPHEFQDGKSAVFWSDDHSDGHIRSSKLWYED